MSARKKQSLFFVLVGVALISVTSVQALSQAKRKGRTRPARVSSTIQTSLTPTGAVKDRDFVEEYRDKKKAREYVMAHK